MEEINIGDFFRYLKSYIIAIVVVVALAIVGVLAYDTSIKKPVYQAQTTVLIAKTDAIEGSSAANINDVNVSQKLVATYSEIAKSELVLNKVIENLGLHSTAKELGGSVTIKPVNDTSILAISVKNLDAKLSAVIANEIASVLAEQIKIYYGTDNTTQLSLAATPESPANNTTSRDIVLAAIIAALAVVGVAFLKYYLDDTVKYSEDIEKTIGMPVTGRISKGEVKTRKVGGELIAENLPKAIVSENIKSLRTNLQFTAVDKDLETILVTSTNASEGKSFVSSNLAISFAQADKRVLLVDCDLRKGRVHRLFNLSNSRGLSNLLAGDLRNFSKYINPTKIKNLSIITCGTYPPNPSELLASKKNNKLMGILRDFYDVVIFDGAPVGGLADSVILSSLVDETLIVVREGVTSKNDLIAVRDSLNKVGAKVAGLVFNMTNRKATRYYNNYYYGDKK